MKERECTFAQHQTSVIILHLTGGNVWIRPKCHILIDWSLDLKSWPGYKREFVDFECHGAVLSSVSVAAHLKPAIISREWYIPDELQIDICDTRLKRGRQNIRVLGRFE